MEIRRNDSTGPLKPGSQPARPVEGSAGRQAGGARQGDSFQRQIPAPEDDAPFWLVHMSTDRLAGRQYLDKRAHREAARLEERWVASLVAKCTPAARACCEGMDWPARGAKTLAAFQGLVDVVSAAGGVPGARAVWLPGKLEGRGQYLFQLAGSLIQLRPEPAGRPGAGPLAWLETVAHESFHHLQQELVVALYKGEPVPPALAPLAAYYRDARAVYQAPSAALPPERHKRQALEIGAWRFGAGLAATVGKG